MANVGDAGSDQRQQWWDRVISKAYSIQNIPEIRRPADPGPDQPSWRNRLGGTTEERQANWLALPRAGVNGAEFLRASLGLQIQLVADTYDLVTLLMPNHPINTLDRASLNLDRLVFADIIWGPEEDPIPRGGEASSLPLAPPCPPDDPRFGADEGCTPDPSYVSLDWTLESLPYLNSAVCEYYVPIRTAYPCPGAEELPARVEEYAPEAIIALMDFLNKEYDPEATMGVSYAARTAISSYMMEESAYEFDKMPNRNLKLLYKVPFHMIRAFRLAERVPPPANENPLPGFMVEIETADLIQKLDRLKVGLKRFTSEQALAWKVEGVKIVKAGSSMEVNVGGKSELLKGLKEAVSAVLTTNKYKMALGVDNKSKASNLPDYTVKGNQYVANKMGLTVSSNYELEGIAVKERGSEMKQINISSVPDASPLRDPTLLSYLVNLDNILFDLDRTNPIDFMEFATAYQFPVVEATYASMDNATQSPNEGGACDDLSPEDVGNLIGNSVLDLLVEVSDLFASEFAEYGCMTPQQLKERNKKIAKSSKKMKKILDDQRTKEIPTGDPLLRNIGGTVTAAINQGGDITVAWEKMFNKMTMCGLLSLILKTLKTIASTSVCGTSLEDTLQKMIGSALGNIEPIEMKRLFNNIPPALQELIITRYEDNFTAIAASMGYVGSAIFPWEYEEEQALRQDRADRGIVLYEVPEFSITTTVDLVAGATSAYSLGVSGDFANIPQGNNATAFWSGYLSGFGSDNVITLDDAVGAIDNVVPVSKSVDFATAAAQAFVQTLIQLLDVDQLIDLTKEIPVIGGLIQAIVQVGKCVVNRNLEATNSNPMADITSALDFSSMMNNLTGGDKDLCELITSKMPTAPGKRKKGPKRPIALPDLEQIMQALKSSCSWSAIQDTIIAVLKEKIIQILVTVLVKLISKAAEAMMGAVCSLMNGSAEQALGRDAANPLNDENMLAGDPKNAMKSLFSNAFCSAIAGAGSTDVDSLVGALMSSLGGLDPLETVELTGPDSVDNFMSAVSSRVNINEMLDLLQGQASPATAEAVVDVLQERAVPLRTLFTNPSTVIDFFGNLGAVFPSNFLSQARRNLAAAGVTQETIASICDPDPLSDLADALREECGDGITEEQIQEQVENFERRLQDLVGDLSDSFGSGMEKSMTKTIQGAIADILPKDEPGNLTIADDVISSLLDPFYLQYAHELMKPLNPVTRAGGFLNLVLANRDGVPQRGQINAYNMLASFPLLPPPFGDLVAEGAAELLRNGMFGSEAPTSKPTTVAKQQQTYLLNGMDSQFSDDVLTLRAPLYELNYNFDNGSLNSLRFSLIPALPPPPLPGLPPFIPEFVNPLVVANKSYAFVFSEKEDQLERLGEILYSPTPSGPSLESAFELIGGSGIDSSGFAQPLNVGTAALAKNFIDNGFELGGTRALEDFREITQGLRRTALESLGAAVALPAGIDNPTFIYGKYNIQKIQKDDIFNSLNRPEPTEEILERGYKVSQMTDGSGRVMIQPPLKGGWLEVKDILMPPTQDEFCCPQRKELFDVEGIKSATRESYKNIDDDPRLSLNPKTVSEPPYSKILSRMNLAASEALVVTTTRVYIIDYFLRSLAPFRVFRTNVPSSFGRLMPEFIAQMMRKGMRAQGPFPGAPINPAPTPDDPDPLDTSLYGYWYEFLEQVVQSYARRAMDKTVTPPPPVETALLELQQFIEGYKGVTPAELLEERIAASIFLGPIAFLAITMKGLKRRKKLQALAATEDLAMIILNDFIRTEFDRISDDIEEIFTAPPGGWSDSVYLNFVDNAYTIRTSDTNIFDIPSIRGGDGRNPVTNGLASSDFGEKSQFVVESYVRIAKNSLGASRWGAALADGIYGIEELKLALLDIEELPTTRDLTPEELAILSFRPNDYFETFKVGLRLVYIPISEDLPGGAGSVRDAMTAADLDNASRLFKQHSLPSDIGWGRFSIPLVFSTAAEQDYNSGMIFFFNNVRMVGANTRNGFTGPGTINWRELTEQLVSTQAFRAMFEYAVPLPSLNSLVSIYCSQTFVDSVGFNDGWLLQPLEPPPGVPSLSAYAAWSGVSFKAMKRRLKRSFLNIYNSNDFTYREEPLGAKERAAVNELRRNTDIESWEDGIGPDWRDRVLVESSLSMCSDATEPEEP